jgi:ketosteroid isomerase-like protein
MSQENVEIVQRAIDALNDGDPDAYLKVCSPDVELLSPLGPLEGPSTGETGIRRYFDLIAEGASAFRLDVREIRELDRSRVLAAGDIHASSERGMSLTQPFATLYEIEGQKLRRVRVFARLDEALEAAGLSE